MNFIKKTAISLLFLAVLYTGGWFFMAYKINQSMGQFYTTDAPALGYKFYGEQPKVYGFPLAPTITYTKGFENKSALVTFDELTVKGFPIPTFSLDLMIRNNLNIQDKNTRQSIDLDFLTARILIPTSLPKSSHQVDIQEWQESVGAIDVKDFTTAKSGMTIKAAGTIGLDTQLQPTLYQDATIKGHEALIEFLVETGALKPLPAALALSALNAMVQENPKTKEREVNLSIKIQDRVLFLGPMRTISLPRVNWR